MEEKKKLNVPQRGAGRKWAARLKEIGQKRPPKDLVDHLNNKKHEKVAATISNQKDLDV